MNSIYLRKPKWTVKIRSLKAEEEYSSDNRFDAILDVLWGFRFKEAVSVAVIDNKTGHEVACYHTEEEALTFFKKHYPNSSDFTWRNRHEKTPIYRFSSKEGNTELKDDLLDLILVVHP